LKVGDVFPVNWHIKTQLGFEINLLRSCVIHFRVATHESCGDYIDIDTLIFPPTFITSMRALRYHGPKDLRLEDVPEPKCAPTQVKIRPAFVGICGTDLHEYQSQTLIPKPGAPHELSNETSPVTLGHEISGTVVEIGSAVPGSAALKVGDRVAVLPLLWCRHCVPCKDELVNCCVKNGFLGLSGMGGGLSDYVCVQHEAVFKLADNISLEVGGQLTSCSHQSKAC
jgi:D-arabinose 1-dehydrogenase-like Zn-dependent alcohol dehydrogenase